MADTIDAPLAEPTISLDSLLNQAAPPAAPTQVPLPEMPQPKQMDFVDGDPSKVRVFKGGQEFVGPVDKLPEVLSKGFVLGSQDSQQAAYAAGVNDQEQKLAANKGIDESHADDEVFGDKDDEKAFGAFGDQYKLRLIVPNTNQWQDVPADQVADYLNSGWQTKDNRFQTLIDAHRKRMTDDDTEGDLNAAFGRAINTALINIPDTIQNLQIGSPSIGNNTRAQLIAQQIVEKQHGQAQTIGGYGGIAGSVFGAGPFGELAAGSKVGAVARGALAPAGSGLVRSVAGRAVAGGLEGATIMAPRVLVDGMINEDPEAAKEDLLIGLGTGGVLGAIGGVAKAGYQKFTVQGQAQAAEELLGRGEDILKNQKSGQPLSEAQEKVVHRAMEAQPLLENLNQKIANQSLSAIDRAFKEAGLSDKTIESATDKNKESAFDTFNERLKKDPEQGLRDLAAGAESEKVLSRIDDIVATEEMFDRLPKIADLTDEISKTGQSARAEAERLLDQITGLDKENTGYLGLNKLNDFGQELNRKIDWKLTDQANQGFNANELRKVALNKINAMVRDAANTIVHTSNEADAIKLGDQLQRSQFIQQAAQEMAFRGIDAVSNGSTGVFDYFKNIFAKKVFHHIGKEIAGAGGALAGSFVGHPFVGYAGAKAAYEALVDKFVKGYVDSSGTLNGSFLKKTANPSYVVGDAIKKTAAQIDKVPADLKATVIKTVNEYEKQKHENEVKRTLGERANGLSHDQQFALHAQHVGVNQNPSVHQVHIDELLGALRQAHPQFASSVEQGLKQTNQYIGSVIPKNPAPPTMFTKNPDWKPSQADLTKYNETLTAIRDPIGTLLQAPTGQVKQHQVQAIKTLYPRTYTRVQQKVVEAGAVGGIKASYQQRLAMSKVFGEQLDPSLSKTQQFQASYSQQPQGSHGGGGNLSKLPAAQPTMAQKISS